jgi:biotin-dependent carboxylase-like uncharacterized protein
MIEVVEPGLLTTVQTAYGRPGWRHLGVPVGGAADAWSARLANRLVGNVDDAGLFEITLLGPTLRFDAATSIALTGARFDADLDGRPLPIGEARAARAGAALRVGGGDGARCYLAVGGGIEVEPLLGSASTDLRTGFGGLDGRALRTGDRVEVGLPTGVARRWIGRPAGGALRVVAGPHADRLPEGALLDETWSVSAEADRTGVRLDGRRLAPTEPEVPSMALPLGAIQVPPDGRPIVMLADRPVTGGYPVVACVIRADVGRVAQLPPGDEVRFASVSVEDARAANAEREAELYALEPVEPDDLAWTGALE